jgi:hypothetical protein
MLRRIARRVIRGECGIAPTHLGMADPAGAGHVAVGEIDGRQGHQFVHALVPADADIGRVEDLLHRRQAALPVERQRLRQAARIAQGLPQRDGVLHGQARAGADRKMRGAQRVAHQHHIAEAPLPVRDRRETGASKDLLESIGWPSRSLANTCSQWRMVSSSLHAAKAGALPGGVRDLDQEGAHARAVAVMMGAEHAVFGVAEGQRQAVEDLAGAVPDEAVGLRRSVSVPNSVSFSLRTQENAPLAPTIRSAPASAGSSSEVTSLSNSILTPSDSAWAYSGSAVPAARWRQSRCR